MEGLPAGATFGSLVHGVLEHADPQAPDLRAELEPHVVEAQRWWSVDAPAGRRRRGAAADAAHLARPARRRVRLADLGLRDRLCELDFEFPLVRRAGGRAPRSRSPRWRACCAATSPPTTRCAPTPSGSRRRDSVASCCAATSAGRSTSCCGSVRPEQHRYLVVDYKTNRLGEPGEPLTALDYTPELMTAAMLHSHYPLQALLYSVVLHRYLRWRLPGYDPERHLGGILYLYVRGMCGPETPEVDGQPCGVFCWRPPAAMVVELSDLLAGWRDRGGGVVSAETLDRHDRRLALGATGLLREFNDAEVLSAADVHVATRFGAILEESRETVLLAAALAVRAVRTARSASTSTTIADLALDVTPEEAEQAPARLPWPEPAAWLDGGRPPARWSASRCCAWRAARSTSTATGARRARSATTWSPGCAVRPRRSTPRCSRPGSTRVFPGERLRRAARRRTRRGRPVDDRPHRRPGHRQDHHGRRPARRWSPSSTSPPPGGRRASPCARPPARPPPGSRRRSTRRPPSCASDPTGSGSTACSPRRCTGCSAGGPTAGSASATTAATGCRTTSWWSTRPRWSRSR